MGWDTPIVSWRLVGWRRWIVSGSLGVLAVGLASRQAAASQLHGQLADVLVAWLVLAVVLDLSAFAIRALKWQTLLGQAAPSFIAMYRMTMIGALATAVLPLRADELVRAQLAGGYPGLSRARVLGSLLVERLLDLMFLVLIAGLATLGLGVPVQLVWGALLLLLVLALGIAVAKRGCAPLQQSSPVTAQASRWVQAANELALGTSIAPVRLRYALLLALGEWLLLICAFSCVVFACHLDDPTLGLVLLVASYLVFAIPLAPGQVGVYQLAIPAVLMGVGLAHEAALMLAVTAHALLLIPAATIGGLALLTGGGSPLSAVRILPYTNGRG